jgi:GAF domain-containing protein
MMPVREVEIVSTVERVSQQTHALREREALSLQLKQMNHELQQRVRELTTIINIGKAVTSITKQQELLEKIIEGAIYVSSADAGWFLLRQEQAKIFHLVAQKNLPAKFSSQIDTPWDDGISTLVAISGEPLSIHGGPINRFKISQLGQSALVVPVKLKREVIGLLVVIRKKPVPFTTSNSTLVEAVADYASISLMNAMLFRSLENRAQSLQDEIYQAQTNRQKTNHLISSIQNEISPGLEKSITSLNGLLSSDRLNSEALTKSNLKNILDELKTVSHTIANLIPDKNFSDQ